MGRCEKERADFKQQKADHRFCLPNLDIAARAFFAHGHMITGQARLCPSTSTRPLDNSANANDALRSSWSVSRSLRALLSHTLQMV
jgi:hypothetical protein